MEKKHQMILLSADLREVHARLSRRFQAGVAQAAEHGIRIPEGEISNISTGSNFEDRGERA